MMKEDSKNITMEHESAAPKAESSAVAEKKPAPRKVRGHRLGGSRVGHNILIAVLCVIWLIPIVWLVCMSFSAKDGMDTSSFFPKLWSADHYRRLFVTDSVNQFPTWFLNTFKIACLNCVISTCFVLMVAYATSFGKFKARKPLMNVAVMLNLFPGVLTMIAIYFLLKQFGLTNNHYGLLMVYAGSSGLGYLICKGFFDTVPRALCEAARIDGCNEARIFTTIVIPTSRPIIVYTIINAFLAPWMDFVMAKMILNSGDSSLYTVAVGLYAMLEKSLLPKYFTIFCCGGIVVSIPIAVLFFIMQKFYVEGVTAGAVKG